MDKEIINEYINLLMNYDIDINLFYDEVIRRFSTRKANYDIVISILKYIGIIKRSALYLFNYKCIERLYEILTSSDLNEMWMNYKLFMKKIDISQQNFISMCNDVIDCFECIKNSFEIYRNKVKLFVKRLRILIDLLEKIKENINETCKVKMLIRIFNDRYDSCDFLGFACYEIHDRRVSSITKTISDIHTINDKLSKDFIKSLDNKQDIIYTFLSYDIYQKRFFEKISDDEYNEDNAKIVKIDDL